MAHFCGSCRVARFSGLRADALRILGTVDLMDLLLNYVDFRYDLVEVDFLSCSESGAEVSETGCCGSGAGPRRNARDAEPGPGHAPGRDGGPGAELVRHGERGEPAPPPQRVPWARRVPACERRCGCRRAPNTRIAAADVFLACTRLVNGSAGH